MEKKKNHFRVQSFTWRKSIFTNKQERKKSLFEWCEIVFAGKLKGQSRSKISLEHVTSLMLHPGSAVDSPPSRICVALHSKVRRMRRNFYSFQTSEPTVVGVPGWSVLFLVIQMQGPPRQRAEGSGQILACCCFQIG